ncbi:MAG: rod shape-determining protein MreD, partial [Synechococcaceae cyanobacterium]|nr:rod shape-determining protein MreD [Synechococcaceae cyanobacterium]
GRRSTPIERSFGLGLLALLGTALLNLSLMLQWTLLEWWWQRGETSPHAAGGLAAGPDGGVDAAWLAQPGWRWDDLLGAGLHVLLAQTLLTALLAPMLCSLQLLFWRQLGATSRR